MSSTPGAGPSRGSPTISKPFSSTFSLPARRVPQATKGRLSTFADTSSLRLHPDGSRVPADPSSASKGKGIAAKSLKSAGPDARGRWYARDATGSTKIAREKRVREEDEIGEAVQDELQAETMPSKGRREVVGEGEVEVFNLVADTRRSIEKGKDVEDEIVDEKELRKRGRRRKDNESRRLKRARFKEDIRTGRDLVPDMPSLPKDESLPPPDLLKVIHHFASSYYAHAGVLTDKSREYRAVKKARVERRTARLFEQGKNELDEETESNREEDAATSSSRPSKRAQRSRSVLRVTRLSRSSSRRSYSRSTRAEDGSDDEDQGGTTRNPIVKQPDMYKAFSGKGLMAIGILMQEFIAAQVTREPPDDWVEGALLQGKILRPDAEDQTDVQYQLDEDDKEDDEDDDTRGGLQAEYSDKEDEDEDVPRSSDDEKSNSEFDADD